MFVLPGHPDPSGEVPWTQRAACQQEGGLSAVGTVGPENPGGGLPLAAAGQDLQHCTLTVDVSLSALTALPPGASVADGGREFSYRWAPSPCDEGRPGPSWAGTSQYLTSAQTSAGGGGCRVTSGTPTIPGALGLAGAGGTAGPPPSCCTFVKL